MKTLFYLKSHDKEYPHPIKISEEVPECADFNKVGLRLSLPISDLIQSLQ